MRPLQRYPELLDVGLLVLVNHAELHAFTAHMLAHPVLPANRQPAAYRGAFEVLPAGERPDYCFALSASVRSQVSTVPPGIDYCVLEPTLLASRDTGVPGYAPFNEGAITTLGVQTPVYRGGTTPPTIAARRPHSRAGWPSRSTPRHCCRRRSKGIPDRRQLPLRQRRRQRVIQQRRRREAAQSATVNLRNGWWVESFAAAPPDGIFTDEHALILLLAGTIVTLLLSVLLFVIGTGRVAPRACAREDASSPTRRCMTLTGLPNRALCSTAPNSCSRALHATPPQPGRAVRRRRLLQERQRQFRPRGR